MTNMLIFTSFLDNSGQPKQVASLVGYTATKPGIYCTVFAGFEENPGYYDAFMRENADLLIKKNVTAHPNRVINYLARRSKTLRRLFLYRLLQKMILKSTSFHVFGISVFNHIHKNIEFDHVYLWHNTHAIQYTHDENEDVFPRFEKDILSRITFVTVHWSMEAELVKHYGNDVKIVPFKLFYNDK